MTDPAFSDLSFIGEQVAKDTQPQVKMRIGNLNSITKTSNTWQFNVALDGSSILIPMRGNISQEYGVYPVRVVVLQTDDGDFYVAGPVTAYPLPATLDYNDSIANGTATSLTAFGTHLSLGTIQTPCVMWIDTYIIYGFNGVANQIDIQIQDNAGNNINHKSGVLSPNWNFSQSTPGAKIGGAMRAKKTYAVGDTYGFKLMYMVSASNTYIDTSTKVTFERI